MLKNRKARILEVASQLIQKAEATVQGSGMGAEKKKFVIAQIEAMNIKVSAWLDKDIDDIVATLNEKQAWFTENAKDGLLATSGE